MKFKENLIRILNEKKLKQADLQKALNLNKSQISRYVSGQTEPNLETLEKIKIFLNVSYDDLLS